MYIQCYYFKCILSIYNKSKTVLATQKTIPYFFIKLHSTYYYQKLMVLDTNSVYQGAGKQLGAITKMASQASFMTGGPMGLPNSKEAEDYKVTMQFNCK